METKQELLTLNGKEYLLDIEQAIKLGLLKEKDSRVRSWEEFKEKYSNKVLQVTEQETVALAAFSKLLKLRRDWIGEWEPDWIDESTKYAIRVWRNHICYDFDSKTSASLSFPTEKMAKEFLDTFRGLIEEAKILI